MVAKLLYYGKRLKSSNVVKDDGKRNLLHYKLLLPKDYIVSCLSSHISSRQRNYTATDLFFFNASVFLESNSALKIVLLFQKEKLNKNI